MSGRTKLLASVGIGLLALALFEFGLFASTSPIRAIFAQIAILGVLTAVGTVAARNLVHAALYLVAFFFLVACLFVLLEAEFMAAMQVLVYIGAVAILLMFGIMLTRNIQGDETTGGHWVRKLPAAIVALALFGLLSYGIRDAKSIPPTAQGPGREAWVQTNVRPDLRAGTAQEVAVNDMARTLGIELMTRWVIPFEVAGLLLTAALVGAIALAMSDRTDESPRRGALATIRPGTTIGPASAGPLTSTDGLPKRDALQPTATATASQT